MAPTPILSLAAEMNLRAEGRVAEAGLLKEVLNTTPTRASQISKAWKEVKQNNGIKPYTPDEALALMLDTDISRQGYQRLRMQAKARGANLYPSYKRIQKAKQKCYPLPEFVIITGQKSVVTLQALLDLTVDRMAQIQDEVFSLVTPEKLKNCVLITKSGFDGSGSQPIYKQAQENVDVNYSNLLMTCIVPLQLYCTDEGSSKKIILWQNARPSSTRLCRPLKLEFLKETKETILQEGQNLREQIQKLLPSKVTTKSGHVLQIIHSVTISMIDGKVVNALTGTASAQRCYICGALPKEMNDLDNILQREINESSLEFGLSTLHAYIRFLEWILHVSYRLDIKTYFKTKAVKDIVERREAIIKNNFKTQCGLMVDMVKEGSGTTNDGNTARQFFMDPAKTSVITGIDEDLIDRCDTILRTLSCGYAVNVEAFREFSLETARLYVKLYKWYPMPASVHKILIHGSQAIAVALLPIGMLSEEAQESRNKDFRKFREHKSRKTSRKATMEDVFNSMLLSSDPVLSSLRPTPVRKDGSFKKAVLSLLDAQTVDCKDDDDISDEN